MKKERKSFDLPEEVVVEILVRLAVKSLLRFKSVCKTWYALINNPNFASLHFNFHNIHNNGTVLFSYVEHEQVHVRRTVFKLASYEKPLQIPSLPNYHLPPPFLKSVCAPFRLRVLGPLNGILCLFSQCPFQPLEATLWNPATRESIALPSLRGANLITPLYGVGFGFDSEEANHYKVVRFVAYSAHQAYTTYVEVYSPTTNSCRPIQPIWPSPPLHCLIYLSRSTYFNGACHWWTRWFEGGLWHNAILSFDMGREAFLYMSVPNSLKNESFLIVQHLGVINECMAVVTNIVSHSMDEGIGIWVLKDFGVEDSWTKLFTIIPSEEINRLVGLPKDHKFYVQTITSQLAFRDLDTGETKNLQLYDYENSMDVVSYTESLFSIKGGNMLQQSNSLC